MGAAETLSETPYRDYQGATLSGKNALYTAVIAAAVVVVMKKLGASGGLRIGA